ncbi:MAG: hypothetical protein AAF654_09335 [Myxococcota bacterium]
MHAKRFVLCCLLSLCTVGCSDATVDSGREEAAEPDDLILGDGVTVSSLKFLPLEVGAVCDWYSRCEAEQGRVFPDRATCVEFSTRLRTLFGAIALPDSDLDAPRAADCLAALAAAPCDSEHRVNLAGCDDLEIPNLEDGECCVSDRSCIAGFLCDPPVNGPGVCRAAAQVGDDCSAVRCAPDLVCSEGVCVERPGLGEPCSFLCVGDLECFGQPEPTCQEQKALQQPCEEDIECESGRCDGVCVAVALGASCESFCPSQPFGGPECVSDSRGVKTCRELGNEVGQPCSEDSELEPGCSPFFGLECVDGACALLPAVGEPCENEACQPYLETFCEIEPGSDSGVCRPRLELGADCDLERSFDFVDPCGSGAFCVDGVCRAQATVLSCEAR